MSDEHTLKGNGCPLSEQATYQPLRVQPWETLSVG
jgi:hypothetical protein